MRITPTKRGEHEQLRAADFRYKESMTRNVGVARQWIVTWILNALDERRRFGVTFVPRSYRFQPYSPTFFPAGIRKTRGIVNKSPRPKEMKVMLKPLVGFELRWRIIVINEIPNAPPTDLNIPRSPVMVATFSGISSMHALLEAGRAIPIPIPETSTRKASISAIPK